jgi:hypothetical protein
MSDSHDLLPDAVHEALAEVTRNLIELLVVRPGDPTVQDLARAVADLVAELLGPASGLALLTKALDTIEIAHGDDGPDPDPDPESYPLIVAFASLTGRSGDPSYAQRILERLQSVVSRRYGSGSREERYVRLERNRWTHRMATDEKKQRRVAIHAAAASPNMRLRKEVQLRSLEDLVDQAEVLRSQIDDQVGRARLSGASWSDIGQRARMTPQGAHRRWTTAGKERDRAAKRALRDDAKELRDQKARSGFR